MPIKRHDTAARLSQAVETDTMVFTAGILGDDQNADAATQTRQALAKIEKYLAACGTDKTKLLSAQIWLSDIRYYDAMNSVWDPWVPAGAAPARACIESRLAAPGWKVEIMVVAAK